MIVCVFILSLCKIASFEERENKQINNEKKRKQLEISNQLIACIGFYFSISLGLQKFGLYV